MSLLDNGGVDTGERLAWAEDALPAAGAETAIASGGRVSPDSVEPDGRRWRVLRDLQQLSDAVGRDYASARSGQRRQAWESRFGGPVATGGGAAAGSVVSAVGTGLIKSSAPVGWVLGVLGVLLAIAGSVFSDAFTQAGCDPHRVGNGGRVRLLVFRV